MKKFITIGGIGLASTASGMQQQNTQPRANINQPAPKSSTEVKQDTQPKEVNQPTQGREQGVTQQKPSSHQSSKTELNDRQKKVSSNQKGNKYAEDHLYNELYGEEFSLGELFNG